MTLSVESLKLWSLTPSYHRCMDGAVAIGRSVWIQQATLLHVKRLGGVWKMSPDASTWLTVGASGDADTVVAVRAARDGR